MASSIDSSPSSLKNQCLSNLAYCANNSDPILAMAVANALGPLVKTRHTLSSKIIQALLNVDLGGIPHASPDPTKTRLQLRSLSKTIRIHLSHYHKSIPPLLAIVAGC